MFRHRRIDYRGNTGSEKFENIPPVAAGFHVPLHDSSAARNGIDVHEQLNLPTIFNRSSRAKPI